MKFVRKRSAAILQRFCQAAFLILFLVLTFSAGTALLPSDAFMRLDPLMAAILPVLNRTWAPEVVPGLMILAAALLAGRFFCGYVCPLGTTLDLMRGVLKTMFRPLRGLVRGKGKDDGDGLSENAGQSSLASGSSGHPPTAHPEGRVATPDERAKAGSPSASPGRPTPEVPDNDADKIVTRGWFQFKYLALALVLVTALLGVNTILWGAPLMLATRFYALFLEPVLRVIGEWGLAFIRPLTNDSFWHYAGLAPRFYSGFTFLLIFFGALFVLELVKPRFWCRYLCPAGALLGVCAHVAPWRRRVKKCISCGACAKICPTEAITVDGLSTARRECITCRACVDVCPVRGVTFSLSKQGELEPLPPQTAAAVESSETAEERAERVLSDLLETEKEKEHSRQAEKRRNKSGAFGLAAAKGTEAQRIKRVADINDLAQEERPFTCTLPSRRAFLGASAVGMLLSFVHVASAKRLLSRNVGPRARPAALLRPPGALPEIAFLSRCVRCGLCIKACPSNGLQPAWGTAWIEDIFSPVLIPRRGPCEPDCNACGRVCPSLAIAPLPLEHKQWAKIGTAEVQEARCLAFAENRACVVCQEVCPFGAIDLVRVPNVAVAVPKVNAERCFGCGYCEENCPTARPAILAKPDGALRLETDADYPGAAKAAGLNLVPRTARAYVEDEGDTTPQGQLPPGFVE